MAYRGMIQSLETTESAEPRPLMRGLFPGGGLESVDTAAVVKLVAGGESTVEVEAPVDDVQARIGRALIEIEDRDFEAAARTLDPAALPADASLEIKLEWAEALARANLNEQSDALFEALMQRYPASRRVNFLFAKRLFLRGLALRSAHVLEKTKPFEAGSSQHAFVERVRHLRDLIVAGEGREVDVGDDCRMLAMKHAIGAFRNRPVRELPQRSIGKIVLMTGGLGPGGAERQLSRTAVELEMARRREGQVGGIAIERPVEVIVRSHSAEGQRDFFLSDLKTSNVEIREIDRMAALPTHALGVSDPNITALLDYLPAKVNFGLRRLVAHFRERQPDVVSLWQDGACLFGALAAVVAGVPRIQLVIRGLPPVIRKHMFQPEYEVMYRAMAALPGVEFISNSMGAAKAYAHWLDVPIDRFSIVYNGVQRMECTADERLDQQWSEFIARTPDATHTVGGVFRFDTDKRPTTWIRFAARYAKHHPESRFLLVGGGRLLEHSIALAEELGVADRILFVGRSTDVGYWMKKMDVLVLMSSFEGLPNVLIEAQYLGVPVVSTPAGGASECFIEGVTGHILGCADKTDLDEACEKVQALVGRAHDPAVFEPATRDFLEPNFSVPKMLENFVHVTCGVARA